MKIPLLANEVIGPPDFVGAGAQRCGTTRWFQLLAQHPEIDIPHRYAKQLKLLGYQMKERRFFARYSCEVPEKLAELYASIFPRVAGKLTGEWTPCYAYEWWAIPMLAQAAPNTKLLFSVRDPVERYISGVPVTNSCRVPPLIATDAFQRGLYALQLKHMLRYFQRSQILVLQFEKTMIDPVGEMARTCEFLELDPFTPTGVEEKVNQGRGKKMPLKSLKDDLRASYAEDVSQLVEMVPELDVKLWLNFRD